MISDFGKKNLIKINLNVSKTDTSSLIQVMGNAMKNFSTLFTRNKFDLFIILGDRYETLSIALSSVMHKIPLVHINGGEKTFGSSDTYEFQSNSSFLSNEIAKSNLDNIYVVPDPYVVTASWEKPLYYSSGRGERRIDFVNLPSTCTINIFSMSGKHIKKINRQSAVQNGAESWDLVTEDGLTVSYGVYIYHVDAPEIGTKIGKFSLIK